LHVNDSLATFTTEAHAGHVTVQLKASDLDMVKNRFRSELSVLCNLEVKNGKLQMAASDTQSIAYELRQARRKMTLVNFEHQVTPFIRNYLPNLFSGDGKLTTFYTDLDRTVENVLHNGTNEFGDVAISMQAGAPAELLSAWFIPRDPARLKRDQMILSKSLQASFRTVLPLYYLQEDSKLAQNFSIAALLVWAAMPISTAIDFDQNTAAIKQFNRDNDVFWDWPSLPLRHAVALDSHTTASLAKSLVMLQKRLQEAGDSDQQFFDASSAPSWQKMSITPDADTLLQGLLLTEARMIRGAAKALEEVHDLAADLKKAPSHAIKAFADFGADFTQAFHDNLSSVYGGDSLRALSSMVLVEASRAIAPELSVANSSAMLTILTLTNNTSFDLATFLDGKMPPKQEVAVAQTLVNI